MESIQPVESWSSPNHDVRFALYTRVRACFHEAVRPLEVPLRIAALACGAALMLAATLYAQDSHRATPVFSSEVSLVQLPIYVVDRQGRAVRGLGPEDFTVEEDGKRVEVVSFRYVDTTSPEDQQEIREAPAARRRFLLLFDKSFTIPAGLDRARRGALDFVRMRMAPSDLAAVATVDVNRGLHLVANFTGDRRLLAHAIETLGVPTLSRITDPLGLAEDMSLADLKPFTRRTEEGLRGELTDALVVLARRMRSADDQAYRAQVQTLMASLGELALGLRRVEGRKQVLYFSAGFDSRVLTGETGESQRQAAEAVVQGRLWDVDELGRHGDTRARDVALQVTRALAGADAVVHTIDVTGLATQGSLAQLSPGEIQLSTPGREALSMIASETGGRFFRNANDLAPVLDEMEQMTSRYYVLGFQPVKEKGPGAYHKVKVEVARKSVNVSHRPGYYEKTPVAAQTLLQRQFEAAQLVMTGAGESDLRFSALCLPVRAPGDKQTLGIVLQVPKESLAWASGKPVAIEAYGYGIGEDGTVYDHFAQLARVDPAAVDPDGTIRGLSFFGTLSVPPGKYTVRLMVQDRDSGSAGVQFLDVTVPSYDAQRGFLLPPMLMDDAGRWVALEMSRKRASASGSPFQVDGEPFIPRANSEFSPGKPQQMVLIAFEPDRRVDPAADVQIRSSLTDDQGRAVPAGFLRVSKVHHDGQGRHTYVLAYTPEVAEAGDYTLRIGLGDGASRLEAYSLIRLRPGS
jgi:VWFA-related protein